MDSADDSAAAAGRDRCRCGRLGGVDVVTRAAQGALVLGFLPVVPMTIVSALLMIVVSRLTPGAVPSEATLGALRAEAIDKDQPQRTRTRTEALQACDLPACGKKSMCRERPALPAIGRTPREHGFPTTVLCSTVCLLFLPCPPWLAF